MIFLILGIGADNIFVYFDTYEQSRSRWQSVRGIMTEAEAGEKNVYGTGDGAREVLVARVAYTYKRATGTIFMTNLTTSLAFLSTGVSEVVPIAAFGYYAASCIVANFLFSVLGYPAFAVVYELYFRDKAACCCCSGAHSDDDDMTKGVGASSTSTGSASLEDGKSGAPSNGPAGHRQFVRVAEEEQALTWEEKIIHRGYVPFEFSKVSIGGRTVRLVPILCTGVLMVFIFVMASLALQLETPTELTQNFSDDHMDSSFLNDFFNIFKGGSDFMTTEVTFGIKGIDRGCLSKFEPDGCRGSAIFDDAFDLAPQANQQYVLDLCADYAALSCVPVGATEPLVGCVDDLGAAVRSVDCTLQDFHDWHNATHPTDPLPALELGTSNSTLWNLRLSEFADEQGLQRFVGFIDGTLKLFVFTYEATLITNGPVPTKEPVLDLLDAFLDAEAADAPAGLDTVFQAGLDFNFINTGESVALPLRFLTSSASSHHFSSLTHSISPYFQNWPSSTACTSASPSACPSLSWCSSSPRATSSSPSSPSPPSLASLPPCSGRRRSWAGASASQRPSRPSWWSASPWTTASSTERCTRRRPTTASSAALNAPGSRLSRPGTPWWPAPSPPSARPSSSTPPPSSSSRAWVRFLSFPCLPL